MKTAIGRGKFKILTPPVPFTMEVEAEGYETWRYSSDGSGKHLSPMQISRGEKKEMTIALQPLK